MKRSVLTIAILAVFGAPAAWSATDSAVVTVNTTVAARASLVLSSNTISFPDADPTSVASIPATQNAVSVTARIRSGTAGLCTLQVVAGGDLVSGGDSIAISNVTWTATGTGFAAGTMDKSVAQQAGSWTGPGARTGSFSYFLANSWNYATGNYTASVTYTLTAP